MSIRRTPLPIVDSAHPRPGPRPRSHRCTAAPLLTLLAIGPPCLARAASPSTCELDPGVLTRAHCPAVFGDAQARQGNRSFRHDVILDLEVGEHCIDLVHSAGWYTPVRLHYRSLSLLDARAAAGCAPVALVHLDSEVADVTCPSGVYALRVDDALGESARILAVLDGLVLIETGDQLGYLRAEDAERPVWRLTWQSPWRFKVPKNYGKVGGRPPNKKPPPRRPAARRRR